MGDTYRRERACLGLRLVGLVFVDSVPLGQKRPI